MLYPMWCDEPDDVLFDLANVQEHEKELLNKLDAAVSRPGLPDHLARVIAKAREVWLC